VRPLRLCVDDVAGHPAVDTAIARVLLERVDAVAATEAGGFTPVLRLAGDRPAVFTPSTIAFAWSVPTGTPAAAFADRFDLAPWSLDADTLARAEATLDHHLPVLSGRR
jgi:hypothetical protein